MLKAIVIDKANGEYRAALETISPDRLPEGNVVVGVEHSTVNYKDALAITGKGPIVRSFPMIPGIDFAGAVAESDDGRFAIGDKVVLNGWGVGENHWGGLAQKARVKADWLIPLPEGLSTRDAMAIGTAGYTAMLCVMALEAQGVRASDGDILVTGAGGGVGSFSIAILSALGYRVVASTGRLTEEAYLKELGASEVVDRATLEAPGKPLQKERWAGAIDSIGSHTLANVCAATRSDGTVAACGMVQGLDFPGSVAPFILRGVRLIGVNSVTRPYEERVEAWRRLAQLRDSLKLDAITNLVGLDAVLGIADEMVEGKVRGRVIVDVNAQSEE